jgi:CheY-like chemotaxis protein
MDKRVSSHFVGEAKWKGFSIPQRKIHHTEEVDSEPLAPGATKGSNERILIVDDEENFRMVISEALSARGFRTVAACNGQEALDLFVKYPFDLVLTDLQMPKMNGWSLASQIKDRSPDTPVVVMTGQPKENVISSLEGSRVDSVLFKPMKLKDLEKTTDKMLGH